MSAPKTQRWCAQAVVAFALALAFFHPAAIAHPVHATLAEMEWNAEDRLYEVSLQLQRVDVEQALGAMGEKRTAVGTDPEATKALQRLVATNFEAVFIDEAGKRITATLTPVGVESKPRVLWYFFTVALDGHQATALVNRLFLTHSKTHLNTVSITERDPSAKDPAEKIVRSHVFNRKTPSPWNVAQAFAAARAKRAAARARP